MFELRVRKDAGGVGLVVDNPRLQDAPPHLFQQGIQVCKLARQFRNQLTTFHLFP